MIPAVTAVTNMIALMSSRCLKGWFTASFTPIVMKQLSSYTLKYDIVLMLLIRRHHQPAE